MSNLESEIEIRPIKPDDLNFIYSTWLRSYKSDSYFALRIPDNLFYVLHHAIIESILAKPSVTVYVATPPGDPETILAWLCTERLGSKVVIHYSYTKTPFRHFGIVTKLLKEAGIALDDPNIWITHWTKLVNDIAAKHKNLIYNPYAI